MILTNDEKLCCGCRTCEETCPVHCINMKEGTLGHLFPSIDNSKCISCNACSSVCPIQNNDLKGAIPSESYIAFNKKEEIRKISSSGGMFFSIASKFIGEGYVVFGASFDKELQLKTLGVTRLDELPALCKSKYLQSNTEGVYKRIKLCLEDNRGVVFCGTPCQIAGLRLFLKKDYPKLILIDFFCHGVPSQAYFDKCINYLEKRKNIKILSYSFRTKKRNGVTPHYFTVKYLSHGLVKEKTDFYYNSPNYAAFQSYINLRESCYSCSFSTRKRYSDITIGDFHEVEKYNPNINRFDGVSLVIINTDKGKEVISDISETIEIESVQLEKLIEDKIVFTGGTLRPNKRNAFIQDYESLDFCSLNEKWFGKKRFFKQRIYYHLPKLVRRIIKKAGGIDR